jgi:excisionase family DNA binding protein
MLRISRTAVYGLLASRELASIKIGKVRRIPRRALDDFVSRQMALAAIEGSAPVL